MRRRSWIVVAAVLGLTGCAAPLKKQAFNRDAAAGVRAIAVVHQTDQTSFDVIVA